MLVALPIGIDEPIINPTGDSLGRVRLSPAEPHLMRMCGRPGPEQGVINSGAVITYFRPHYVLHFIIANLWVFDWVYFPPT